MANSKSKQLDLRVKRLVKIFAWMAEQAARKRPFNCPLSFSVAVFDALEQRKPDEFKHLDNPDRLAVFGICYDAVKKRHKKAKETDLRLN